MSLIVIGTWLTATRPAGMSDLQQGLSSGQITQIELVGELDPRATGTALVDILWHDGWFARCTTVQQASSGADLEPPPPPSPWPTSVVGTDLRGLLSASTPSGELEITSEAIHADSHGLLFGWRVPTWLALLAMAWGLTVLGALVTGPEPRRATRWAWFWLMGGTGPFALVLYPLVGMPRAGDTLIPARRRLTGGWAFLIALLIPKPTL